MYILDLKPILCRYLNIGAIRDELVVYALKDVFLSKACEATDSVSEHDELGSSSYLITSGLDRSVLVALGQEILEFIRSEYIVNCPPHIRNHGKRRIQIDSYYNVIIEAGVDPYV